MEKRKLYKYENEHFETHFDRLQIGSVKAFDDMRYVSLQIKEEIYLRERSSPRVPLTDLPVERADSTVCP